MRNLGVVLASLFLSLVTVATQSQPSNELTDVNGSVVRLETTVTARFVNAELGDVVRMLGDRVGITVRVAQDVPPTLMKRQVSMHFQDAVAAQAFKAIFDVAGVSFRVVDAKTWELVVKP